MFHLFKRVQRFFLAGSIYKNARFESSYLSYLTDNKYKMGHPVHHKKVKLIIGFIFNDEIILKKAESLISKKFGPIDSQSQLINFSRTDYYNKEFGKNLRKKFISLKYLVSPENIYMAKLITNNMERKLSKFGKRMINIDPGYITLAKLVLLTTKDGIHRVYLREGIYAETTLKFHKGGFCAWEATYPDYRTDDYIRIFNEIRNLYKNEFAGIG